MIGGLGSVMLMQYGLPMPLAIVAAIVLAVLAGILIEKLAIERAATNDIVPLIIITIGASLFLRGGAQFFWGKSIHALPAFTGNTPINIAGATILPQSLWVLGIGAVVVCLLAWFFTRTLTGKAMLAVSHSPNAARLVGINPRFILMLSFALAGALGAVAGAVAAPITLTVYDVGVMLGLKGFVAAVLGGLGSPLGAVAGGLLLGIMEAFTAGYISSEYKDAVPFVIVLLVLFFMPSGLFGSRATERV
jgi:branched-chain amino acid transport system permease protein